MKNIEEIMKEAGAEITAEQLTAIAAGVKENYRTVADYEKQKDKLATAEDKVKTLTDSLGQFEGVDAEAMSAEIQKLKDQLEEKDAEYSRKISDRDFDDIVKDAITGAKGRNAKAIRALLDLDTLRASKNQKEDVAAAIQALTEAEDSAMLFTADKSEEPDAVGKVDAIGTVGTGSKGAEFEGSLRAAMGLPAKAD